ncbi:MAG: hypothetical protein K8T26_03355 [Lentisphaerae bacterium]|nr:hypothetical protein [Lentisphaerota bacterium]
MQRQHGPFRLHPGTLAIFLALGSVVLYGWLVGSPTWESNDDVAMNMMAAGVWTADGQPSADLLYMHPAIGWCLSRLYRLHRHTPWYALTFLAVLGTGLATCLFAVLRLKRDLPTILVAAGLAANSALLVHRHLQFTSVAGLATLAAIMLAVSQLLRPSAGHVRRTAQLIAASAFFGVGLLIRGDAALMIVALAVPGVGLLALQAVRRSPAGTRAKPVQIMGTLTALFVAVFSGVQLLDHHRGAQAPEWRRWRALNRAKSEYTDYKRIPDDAAFAHRLRTVGWSRNDCDMIATWQYLDPVRYAPEKLDAVTPRAAQASRAQLQAALSPGHRAETMHHMVQVVRAGLGLSGWWLALSLFALLITREMRWHKVAGVAVLAAALAEIAYLSVVLNHTPLRVLIPVALGASWLLLLVCVAAARAATPPPPPPWRRAWRLLGALILVVACWSLLRDYRHARWEVAARLKTSAELRQVVNQWVTGLPPDALVYMVGNAMPLEDHLPCSSFEYLRPLRGILINLGCANQSPPQRELLASMDLTGDIYAALARREHVYYVRGSLLAEAGLKCLRRHYRDVYGLSLTLIEEPQLPWLYRMAFADIRPRDRQ